MKYLARKGSALMSIPRETIICTINCGQFSLELYIIYNNDKKKYGFEVRNYPHPLDKHPHTIISAWYNFNDYLRASNSGKAEFIIHLKNHIEGTHKEKHESKIL